MGVGLNKLVIFILVILTLGCIYQTDDVVENMQRKYESLESYKAVIHQVDLRDGRRSEVDYVIYFKKPDRFRIESDKFVLAWTSKVIWRYDKRKNEIEMMEINASEPFDYFGFILKEIKKHDVRLDGLERIYGKDCYVLDVIGSEEQFQLQKVWVVKGEWYPAKVLFRIKTPEKLRVLNSTLPNETISIWEFREMKFNVEILDEMFEPPDER